MRQRIQNIKKQCNPNVLELQSTSNWTDSTKFDRSECSKLRNGKTYDGTKNISTGWSGSHWASARTGKNVFSTILGPNAPSCVGSTYDDHAGIMSASSYHSGGVQCALGDGAVKFITDSVDTGPATNVVCVQYGPSPFGVWGALGSISGGESHTIP